jgi:hypothetical protein
MSAHGHHGLLLASSASSFAAYMASLSPVAWWRMNEPLGSTYLNDSIANEQATLSGTFTLQTAGLVTNDNDKAVSFSGNGAANAPISSKWTLGSGDFSAFVIAEWTTTALSCIAAIRDSSTNIMFLFIANLVTSGDIGCETWNWNTQKITISGSFNDGKRHVLGMSYVASTNTLRFYVDGVLKGTQVQSGSYSRPASTVTSMSPRVANNYSSQYFIGVEDELAFFSRQLTDAEMSNLATLALNG